MTSSHNPRRPRRSLGSLFLLCLSVLTNPSQQANLRLQKRQPIPSTTSLAGWVQGDPAQPAVPVSIHLALAQSGLGLAVGALQEVSDPGSAKYGKHWTAADVARAFAPDPAGVAQVLAWLNSSGVAGSQIRRSHAGGFFEIQSTAGEAGQLLNTTFHHFQQAEKRISRVMMKDGYHVPQEIGGFVDYVIAAGRLDGEARAAANISPSPSSGKAKRRRVKPANSLAPRQHPRDLATSAVKKVDCNQYTVPSCLREIYNIPPAPKSHPNNSIGVLEINAESWLAADLDGFFSRLEPDLVGARPTVSKVDGGYLHKDNPGVEDNLEPDLDFEYVMALLLSPEDVKNTAAAAVSTATSDPGGDRAVHNLVLNVQVGDSTQLGNANHVLAALDGYYCGSLDPTIDGNYAQCGTVSPLPKVLSVSYAGSEADFPPEYLDRQCIEFLKLGLMGVTTISGSGDAGVESGDRPGHCLAPEAGGVSGWGRGAGGGAGGANAGLDPSQGAGGVNGYQKRNSNAYIPQGHGGQGGVVRPKFSPSWPATCPYVTSVGGTRRVTQSETDITKKQKKRGLVGSILAPLLSPLLGSSSKLSPILQPPPGMLTGSATGSATTATTNNVGAAGGWGIDISTGGSAEIGTNPVVTPPSQVSAAADISGTTTPSNVETAFRVIIDGAPMTSGGGFSNLFAAPWYQASALASYGAKFPAQLSAMAQAGAFDPRGRGFPDVSALASDYLAYVDGEVVTVYGTSTSTPVFAAIVSLLNNERLNAGKAPLGFLNPALYALGAGMLNDVTTGANQGCGYAPAFEAAEGWDPVTGLGTPDYARMKEVFLSLP